MGQDRTNPYAAARGDKSVMRPFAELLNYIRHSLVVVSNLCAVHRRVRLCYYYRRALKKLYCDGCRYSIPILQSFDCFLLFSLPLLCDALISLHWLRVQTELLQGGGADVPCILHGSASPYL